MKRIILFFVVSLSITICHAQIITTIAGGGTAGLGDGGPAVDAILFNPTCVAKDKIGNLYITDGNNYRIRKVDTAGIITTFAGTGSHLYTPDGQQATNTAITYPFGIAVDKYGDVIYSDQGQNILRKIDTAGMVTTIAGFPGTSGYGYNGDNIPASNAKLYGVTGIAIDKIGNIFIADALNFRVRKIDTFGIITTFAGNGMGTDTGDNGQATSASIGLVNFLAVDTLGQLYLSDYQGSKIRKVDLSGIITTIAGCGERGYNGDTLLATAAKLNFPAGIAVDKEFNVYIADESSNRIRKVCVSDSSNRLITIAGTGGAVFNGNNIPATAANIGNPYSVMIDNQDDLYIVQGDYSIVREIRNTTVVNDVESNLFDFKIFPNPCHNLLRVHRTKVDHCYISIKETNGREVLHLNCSNRDDVTIPLSLPSGIYIICIENLSGSTLSKIFNVQ